MRLPEAVAQRGSHWFHREGGGVAPAARVGMVETASRGQQFPQDPATGVPKRHRHVRDDFAHPAHKLPPYLRSSAAPSPDAQSTVTAGPNPGWRRWHASCTPAQDGVGHGYDAERRLGFLRMNTGMAIWHDPVRAIERMPARSVDADPTTTRRVLPYSGNQRTLGGWSLAWTRTPII